MPAELPRRNAATRERRDYPGHRGTPGGFGAAEHAVTGRTDSPVQHRAEMNRQAGGRHAGSIHPQEQVLRGPSVRTHRIAEMAARTVDPVGRHSAERRAQIRSHMHEIRDLRRRHRPVTDGSELVAVEASFARRADQLGALADRLQTTPTPTDNTPSDAQVIATMEQSLFAGETPAGHHERTRVTVEENQIFAATAASITRGETARDPQDKSLRARIGRIYDRVTRKGRKTGSHHTK